MVLLSLLAWCWIFYIRHCLVQCMRNHEETRNALDKVVRYHFLHQLWLNRPYCNAATRHLHSYDLLLTRTTPCFALSITSIFAFALHLHAQGLRWCNSFSTFSILQSKASTDETCEKDTTRVQTMYFKCIWVIYKLKVIVCPQVRMCDLVLCCDLMPDAVCRATLCVCPWLSSV